MSINRRRFLSISAAVSIGAAIGFTRQNETIWNGYALGANANIKIYGDEAKAKIVLDSVVQQIRYSEKLFSLYDPNSYLSNLNRNSKLINAPDEFINLMHEIVRLNEMTDGLFDPTIQPYFLAYARSNNVTPVEESGLKESVGLHNVMIVGKNDIVYKNKKTAMTLNGIAQGYVTDLVTKTLQSHGLNNILVNVGEFRAGHKKTSLGVKNLKGEMISHITLKDNAVATTSPHAYLFSNGKGHIISANDGEIKSRDGHIKSRWKTVSVIAKNATIADGVSTALALTKDTILAQKLIADAEIQSVIFEDFSNTIITI